MTRVPQLPWTRLEARLADSWKPGQHVTVIAPTGVGKTHLGLTLAELCRYVLVLACKRKDPLVSQLGAAGYHVTSDLDGMTWTADPHRGHPEPTNPRVVYWPQQPEKMPEAERLALQAAAMRKGLAWADRTGRWCVVIDETMWMTDVLKLNRELDSLWFQGRTQGLSVIALAQRPSRVPRLAFSQADYFFFGKYTDQRDLETLRDISSTIPGDLIAEAIRRLSKTEHQFLFVDAVRDEIAVVVAPPR